jgi:hypothetical protein
MSCGFQDQDIYSHDCPSPLASFIKDMAVSLDTSTSFLTITIALLLYVFACNWHISEKASSIIIIKLIAWFSGSNAIVCMVQPGRVNRPMI